MSVKSAKERRHLHQEKIRQSIRQTNYLLQAQSRGADLIKLAEKVDSRRKLGTKSEQIAYEALKASPWIEWVEKATEVDDYARQRDFTAGLRLGGKIVSVEIQVKSSTKGRDDYYRKLAHQFHMGESDLFGVEYKLAGMNKLVLVTGDKWLNDSQNVLSGQKQLDRWVRRYKRVDLGY